MRRELDPGECKITRTGRNFIPTMQGEATLTYGIDGTFSIEASSLIKFLGLHLDIAAAVKKPLMTPQSILLGEASPPVGGDHCACGAEGEPCCDTMVVNGGSCDLGLTCSVVGQNMSWCAPGDGDGGEHACDTIDAYISTPADVAGIVDCTTLLSLSIVETATVATIELPHLLRVGGLSLQGDTLTEFHAPALAHADYIISDAGGLTTIDLPALTTVGRLYLHDNPMLQTVNASALTAVGDGTVGDHHVHQAHHPDPGRSTDGTWPDHPEHHLSATQGGSATTTRKNKNRIQLTEADGDM